MRFVHVYLIGYFLLIAGAILALWQSGVLGRLAGGWVLAAVAIAAGLGIVLALLSRPRRVTTPDTPDIP